MKKLFAVLLALCVAAGAFAQVAIGASGSVIVVDQDGQAKFARDGSGYDLLSIKGADKDGKWGYTAVVDNFDKAGFLAYTATADADLFRNWDAWYKIGDAKVILGKTRNGDIRLAAPNGWIGNYGSTSRFFGGGKYGVIAEYKIDAITVALGLPINETAADTVDVLKKAEIGAKYSNDSITGIGLVRLNLVDSSNEINFGVEYKGVENLDAYALGKATLASSTTVQFMVGGTYTMDKLVAGVEFEGKNTTSLVWDVAARGDYTVNDNITAIVEFDYYSDSTYLGYAKGVYDFGNNLNVYAKGGYDGGLVAELGLGYSVSF
jgi:hypothetical protein